MIYRHKGKGFCFRNLLWIQKLDLTKWEQIRTSVQNELCFVLSNLDFRHLNMQLFLNVLIRVLWFHQKYLYQMIMKNVFPFAILKNVLMSEMSFYRKFMIQIINIILINMLSDPLQLSVSSCGSAAERWKEKPNTSIISKVIYRDKGDFALILKEDASKPLRFLYLTLLIGKQAVENVRKMIAKLENMKQRVTDLDFENMNQKMKQIGLNIPSLLKELNVLRKKIESYQGDNLAILKISQEYDIVDPLLVLSLRTIAHSRDLKIKNASDCESALSFKQIEEILISFGMQRFSPSHYLNKFVLIIDLSEMECQFFKSEGISIETQASNFQELSDPFFLNYEEQIVIQKMFSLL